ncbi:MAG TPA: radical SAM protein, partial [Deferrimonas sp.]
MLVRHGRSLVRSRVHTLQVNTGYLCNLRCRHCHLEAGPGREEIMSLETMTEILSFARRFPFQVIDVTGGAPEMVPDLPFLVEGLAPLAPRLMLRT